MARYAGSRRYTVPSFLAVGYACLHSCDEVSETFGQDLFLGLLECLCCMAGSVEWGKLCSAQRYDRAEHLLFQFNALPKTHGGSPSLRSQSG